MFVCWPPRYDIRPTKQRGQNFVIDANTVRRVVRSATLRADDVVLEVGPGLGSLTLALLEQVASRDGRRDRPGARRGPAAHRRGVRAGRRRPRSRVVEADAMRVSGAARTRPHRAGRQPALQRGRSGAAAPAGEVPVAASASSSWCSSRWRSGWPPRPGSKVYGVPSVKAAWYADVRKAGVVGRTVFWPAPQRRLRPRRDDAARATDDVGDARGGLRRGRRGVRAAAQDTPRRPGVVRRVGSPAPSVRSSPRASTRRSAANASPSRTSPASRTPSAKSQLT